MAVDDISTGRSPSVGENGLRPAGGADPSLALEVTLPPPRRTDRAARLQGHLATPLFRNAYALMAATTVTSALGLVYWGVAARRYPAVDVGRGGAVVAALLLIGGASQLNLNNILPRLLPEPGTHHQRLVWASYGASAVVGVVIAGAFVTLGGVDSSLGTGGSPWPARAAFVAAVVTWNIFTIQDAVLAGIRRSMWVLTKNGLFAVAKIALLVALATRMPSTGIFASWSLPAVLLAVPVGVVLFTRLLPAHVASVPRRSSLPRAALLRYAGADYLGGLFQLAAVYLMPILVAAMVGLEENAAFATAWIAASAFELALASIGISLTVEGTAAEDQRHHLARSTAKLSALISIAGAAATMVMAPPAMALLGDDYSAGVDVLRLLAVAMPFRAAVTVYLSILRLRRDLVPMVIIQAAACTVAVTAAALLLPRQGATGAALAYAVAQALVALCIAPRLISELRGGTGPGRTTGAEVVP